MDLMRAAFSNHILNLCLIASVSAQLCKFLLTLAFSHKVSFERFYGSGGMPSAHTATVCALMMGTVRKCGFASAEFAIAAVFAYVVIYDALGVRRAAGQHAGIINRILLQDVYMAEPYDGEDKHKGTKQLNEHLGHTPIEVIGGALLGMFLSLIYHYFAY